MAKIKSIRDLHMYGGQLYQIIVFGEKAIKEVTKYLSDFEHDVYVKEPTDKDDVRSALFVFPFDYAGAAVVSDLSEYMRGKDKRREDFDALSAHTKHV
jgi:hypothetical protein